MEKHLENGNWAEKLHVLIKMCSEAPNQLAEMISIKIWRGFSILFLLHKKRLVSSVFQLKIDELHLLKNYFEKQFFLIDVLTLMKEINILMDTSELIGSRH